MLGINSSTSIYLYSCRISGQNQPRGCTNELIFIEHVVMYSTVMPNDDSWVNLGSDDGPLRLYLYTVECHFFGCCNACPDGSA